MATPRILLKKSLLANCLGWFITSYFNPKLLSPLQMQFPAFALPARVTALHRRSEQIQKTIQESGEERIDLLDLVEQKWSGDANIGFLFKQMLLLYRREQATRVEGLLAKSLDPEITVALRQQEMDDLDAAVNQDWFQKLEDRRLPKLRDFLPLQLIEESAGSPPFPARIYDEKFRILHAPALFLPDLAYFRSKCEARDTPVAIAFLDIDHFKSFNDNYSETLIDRNLLPRFMQTIEAHVYHIGYAYRQGGDEYLILLPSLSKPMAIAFLEELRQKLAELEYPDIKEKTTVSIGVCIAQPESPFTDRELLERANNAKKEAKKTRNCIVSC